MHSTYNPVYRPSELHESFLTGDFLELMAKKSPDYPYERIGLDRFIAILIDMQEANILPPATLLDIGSNTGFFSQLFALSGYTVTAIDNEAAPQVQGHYPCSLRAIAESQNTELHLETIQFCWTDARKWIAQTQQNHVVSLLLSVVHQWFNGYAGSDSEKTPKKDILTFLENVIRKTEKIIYFETPVRHINGLDCGLDLVAWFTQQPLVKSINNVSHSLDADGEFREIYRIQLHT